VDELAGAYRCLQENQPANGYWGSPLVVVVADRTNCELARVATSPSVSYKSWNRHGSGRDIKVSALIDQARIWRPRFSAAACVNELRVNCIKLPC
jgi:hypothetical protein